ncbi:MAG: SCO family protein [Terricaulis sp.]|nr:SCO family protein [Terricaulis sp.]
MRAYVETEGFPAGLVGLSGTEAQVEAARRAFNVYAQRAAIEGAPAGTYNVDHSSLLYVVDGQWRTRVAVPTWRQEDPRDPPQPARPDPARGDRSLHRGGAGSGTLGRDFPSIPENSACATGS